MESTSRIAELERIARGYLESYGSRDIDKAMSYYADDVLYYVFSSTSIADGAAAVRERLTNRFRDTSFSARLLKQMVLGNWVISHQILTLTFPEGPGTLELIAMQEVENGKIARSWFKLGNPVLDRMP